MKNKAQGNAYLWMIIQPFISRVLSADDSVLRGLLEAEKSAGKTKK